LRLYGKDIPFQISAADFADNNRLRAAIQEAGGIRAILYANPDLVRQAISSLSGQPGQHQTTCRTVTTGFGWNDEGSAFLGRSGRIAAAGFIANDEQTDLCVDLSREELARHLDLKPLNDPAEIKRVKQQIVDDLLQLHDRRVTYSALASVAVAVLARFY